MLEKDPDFYRKIIGLNQTCKLKLTITISGPMLRFVLDGKDLGTMAAAQFYSMSVDDIWKTLGVSDGYLKKSPYL